VIEELAPGQEVPDALKPVFSWFESHVERLSGAYATLETRVSDLDSQLEKRNAELESLLDSLHDGVLMVDMSERITMVNGRGAQILGLDPLEAAGLGLSEVFPTQKDFTDPLLHSLHEGIPLRWVEVVWLRSAETPVPLGVSTAPVRDPEGRRLGAVASFQNLTHLKQMERELSQTRTLAALGQMAATVAHEIRNPLGGIGGFAKLLQRDIPEDDPRRRLSERIIEGVEGEGFEVVLHNCAAKTFHLESVAASGAHIVHFGAPMDIPAALAKLPRDMIVCGNLDPAGVFVNSTPGAITQITRNLIAATEGYSNFVISSGCDIPAATPLENLDAFFHEVSATS